ncbi:MAG: hypothetical protein J2P15_17325, partial [Micromonosporaceae bacterium]|nr:hypothetical protein [Micromonosporaceae bacterium]
GIDPDRITAYAKQVHALAQQVDGAVGSLTQLQSTVATAVRDGATADAARSKLNNAITALATVSSHVHEFEADVQEAAAKLRQATAAYNNEGGEVQHRIRRAAASRNGGPQAKTMAAQSQGRAAQGAAQNQPNANPLADILKGLTSSGSGSSAPASTPAPAPAATTPTTPTAPTTPTTPTTSGSYPYSGTAIDPTTGLPVHGIQISFHADGSFDVTSTPGIDPTTGQPTDQSADVTVLTQDPSTHQTVSHRVHIGADGTGTALS